MKLERKKQMKKMMIMRKELMKLDCNLFRIKEKLRNKGN